MKWVAYGPDALLFQFAERAGEKAFARARAIMDELEQRPPFGLIEFVPGFTTMLLEFDRRLVPEPAKVAEELGRRLESASPEKRPASKPLEIPAVYDGPDLERVAAHHKLTVKEVCHLHATRVYTVFLLGFAPGFPYLGELDARLHTPRLAEPRPRVPAGSIGIGGQHTGIYPLEGPGGWNIIGRTTVKLFQPDRAGSNSMFLLKPGDRVKFVPEQQPPG